MFCFQCEQTFQGKGCTRQGVCGKDGHTAAMQDLLIYALKGLAGWARRARELGVSDGEINVFTIEALFTTITNVNFDAERVGKLIERAVQLREKARSLYEEAARKAGKPVEDPGGAAAWQLASDADGLLEQAEEIGIARRLEKHGVHVTGLKELVTYGLKGIAAYADHAHVLGKEDEAIYAFIHEALDRISGDDAGADELTALAIRCGATNLRAMELLDEANTGAYGDPVPTKVRVTPLKGKAIVVSGHDFKDLEALLVQTEGTGINVYTHGEMLPAHGYPGLKKYGHLAGNYGGAWQEQIREFAEFPGAIVMTTNCIQRPQKSYVDRIFTTGLVGWPGVVHIGDRDFKPVIKAALAAEGFGEDAPEKHITVGFGRKTLLDNAEALLEAFRSGRIRRAFVIAGCDGAKPGRNYYTELAEAVPDDCVIVTFACGKYRFNRLDLGEVAGLPKVIDCGQCNDAHSALMLLKVLSEKLGVEPNALPVSLIVSWYEQKAVAVLLALFALGVRNIRLGPSMPAFASPELLGLLSEKFNVMPISTPAEDLKAVLG
ncbi:MAG TPA: hydroxylamine reductase [Planctomycetes bacterium]|nr:hydroxylamine reductase [Planctomycetota bacterium]